MDHGRAAMLDVGAFNQRRQLAFIKAGLAAFKQRLKRRIAHRRTDAEPVEFLR